MADLDRNEATERPLVIRPRVDTDIAGAGAALVRTHASDGYPVEGVDDPEAWLTSPALLKAWVAEIAGTIVGHVAISRPDGEEAVALWMDQSGASEKDVAVLSRLFVAPEARRKSVGESLARVAAEYGQSQGVRLVFDVLTKDTAAIRLYERLGCTRLGPATHAYGAGQQAEAVCYVVPVI